MYVLSSRVWVQNLRLLRCWLPVDVRRTPVTVSKYSPVFHMTSTSSYTSFYSNEVEFLINYLNVNEKIAEEKMRALLVKLRNADGILRIQVRTLSKIVYQSDWKSNKASEGGSLEILYKQMVHKKREMMN